VLQQFAAEFNQVLSNFTQQQQQPPQQQQQAAAAPNAPELDAARAERLAIYTNQGITQQTLQRLRAEEAEQFNTTGQFMQGLVDNFAGALRDMRAQQAQ
jgi:hypothetical protein